MAVVNRIPYGTNQLQLERDMHVLSCECICVRLRVPHVAKCVSFHSNIIITNLQLLSINFMFLYPFSQSSAPAKRC